MVPVAVDLDRHGPDDERLGKSDAPLDALFAGEGNRVSVGPRAAEGRTERGWGHHAPAAGGTPGSLWRGPRVAPPGGPANGRGARLTRREEGAYRARRDRGLHAVRRTTQPGVWPVTARRPAGMVGRPSAPKATLAGRGREASSLEGNRNLSPRAAILGYMASVADLAGLDRHGPGGERLGRSAPRRCTRAGEPRSTGPWAVGGRSERGRDTAHPRRAERPGDDTAQGGGTAPDLRKPPWATSTGG